MFWSILLGGLYYGVRRDFRSATVIGLVVVSHWFLDFVVHRPDVPLGFQGGPYFGLGGWNSLPLTLLLELGLIVLGFGLYLRSTVANDRWGRFGAWALAIVLVVIYFGSQFGPSPPNEQAIALSLLLLWVAVPLGYWIDRHRRTVSHHG